MQRAFLVGNIIAIIAPLIGVFITLKRLALIGDTLSHVALAGVALGLILGIYPIYLALIISILAALAIETLRQNYADYAELSLSIILATGLGLATIFISIAQDSSSIFSFLFGSIALVNKQDVYIVLGLGLFVVLLILFFYYGFFYIAFNEKEARLGGVPVKFLNIILMVLTSVTIALSMRIIGGLLIASLITLPVATGMQIATSFKTTIWASIFFSLLAINTGLFISFYQNLAPGGTIILTSVFLLLIIIIFKKLKVIIRKALFTN